MFKMRVWLFLAAVSLAALSCNVTRHVPDGEYLLRRNHIVEDRDVARTERIRTAELEKYVRQTPNKRLLGTDFYLWTHNTAKPEKDNGWNRMFRRIGEEPVILDTMQTLRSVGNIRNYLRSRGYLDSEARYELDTTKRKKAKVTYTVKQNEPYIIGKISYEFRDKFLGPVILQDTTQTLLREGQVFDFTEMDRERKRIVDALQNRGYYNFSINNIYYVADTTVGNHVADLRMVVRQFLTRYDDNGQAVYENNPIYRVGDIYINPDYNPTTAAIDSRYVERFDTLEYRGLKILYEDRPRVRKRVLRLTVPMYPNSIYSAEEVRRTYDNIMKLGFYRSANITFRPVETDSTAVENMVTFIGGDDMQNSGLAMAQNTRERYLTCEILAIPAMRQSYKVELEGSHTSSFYALTARLGYQNRNLFRGAELFEVNLSGGFEFMRSRGRQTAFEIGVSTGLTFPRFIFPVKLDPYNRALNARTKVELSVNSQRRSYYHRTLISGVWGYSWSGKGRSSFAIRPIDLSSVKMGYINEDFLNSITNEYLKNSYKDQFIAGISGTYVYNNQIQARKKNSFVIRVNWETMGNLLYGLSSVFLNKSDAGYYKIFGLHYAQYFRADLSISNNIYIAPKTSIAYRVYGGAGFTYGNSAGDEGMPFDRLFYSGGNNSMRGWQIRTLGAGTMLKDKFLTTTTSDYANRLANMKLEANVEFRFPVWGILNSAVFFDAGNIWFTKKSFAGGDRAGVFDISRFYRQLGFNTGIGFRFDFDFFLLRLDWGMKLHDPNMPAHQRWIDKPRMSNTTLSFGVGYPF